MAGELKSAASGAQAGATIGASVGGPYGAAVGAVIGGAVGLIGGILSNKKKKLSKKAGRKAELVKRQQQTMQLALQRRDMIRQGRSARAAAINAGASEGRSITTGVAGATGSIDSQLASNLNYFDDQVILDYNYNEFRKKAGKYAGQAADIDGIVDALPDIGELGANIIGSIKKPKK